MIVNPYSFIAQRYFLCKEKRPFVKFIFWFSLLGVAVGCGCLLIVLSLLNGLKNATELRYKQVLPQYQIVVKSADNIDFTIKQIFDQTKQQNISKGLKLQGLLKTKDSSKIVTINGVEPNDFKYSNILKFRGNSNLQDYGLAIGSSLANQLEVTIGSTILLQLPKINYSIVGIKPRSKTMTVRSIFYTGTDLDSDLIFVNLHNLETIWRQPPNRIRVNNVDDTALLKISETLPPNSFIEPWFQDRQTLFAAMRLEKIVTFAMLLTIIFMAVVNIGSALTLFISYKKRDIAILKTLGCSSLAIAEVFFKLCLLISISGIVLGCIFGYLIANNLNAVLVFIGDYLGIIIFDPSLYYISEIPSKWLWSDFWIVVSSTLALSIMVNIFPIMSAYKTPCIEFLSR